MLIKPRTQKNHGLAGTFLTEGAALMARRWAANISLYGIMRYFTLCIMTWFTLLVYFVFKKKETEYAVDQDQCNGTTD